MNIRRYFVSGSKLIGYIDIWLISGSWREIPNYWERRDKLKERDKLQSVGAGNR